MSIERALKGLRGAVRGSVRRATVRSKYRTDYGGYGSGVPDAVVEAVCEDDVSLVLRTSRDLGIPVAVRGAGHSSNGRLAVARGGILLVNKAPAHPQITIGRGVADVEARARWDSVEKRLNRRGAAARVLTDTLVLSVGGTLSVGGYGIRSVRWGAQVDNVQSLRLVLPDGTTAECSGERNRDLFRFALAGVGTVGVIERARIVTTPMPAFSRLYVSQASSWERLLGAIGEVPGMSQGGTLSDAPMEMLAICRTDGTGYLRRRYYFSTKKDAVRAASARLPLMPIAYSADVERAACFSDAEEVEEWLALFPGTRKVWADYLLDYAQFREFMAEIRQRIRNRHPGHRYLPSVYVLAIRLPSRESAGQRFVAASALSPTAGASGTYRFGCGLYHMVPEDDTAGVAAAIAACEELVLRCIELGGRPYLHGVATMAESTRRRVYGEDYDALLRLRRQYDPDGLFNAGWFS